MLHFTRVQHHLQLHCHSTPTSPGLSRARPAGHTAALRGLVLGSPVKSLVPHEQQIDAERCW